MVHLEWKQGDGGLEYLFLGVLETSVATIFPSNTGINYSYLIELPGIGTGWKRYMAKRTLKAQIEKAVQDWVSFACMDIPAHDKVEA